MKRIPTEVFIKNMTARNARSQGDDFKRMMFAIMRETRGKEVELAVSLMVEPPLNALERAIKERNAELQKLCFHYEEIIAGNGDPISKDFLALLRGARVIFTQGGGPEQVMKLPAFDKVWEWVELLRKNPGCYPYFGVEGELGPKGRAFLPFKD